MLFILWCVKLHFTLGSSLAFHRACLFALLSLELCKELSALNPSTMLTGEPREVSHMRQHNDISLPGTKATFIII